MKSPLGGPKGRLMPSQVGIDDPDQRYIWKVQPFGDHLGAEQNINLPSTKIAQDPPVILFSFQGVGIHAYRPGLRKNLVERFFHFLSAQACKANRGIAAVL